MISDLCKTVHCINLRQFIRKEETSLWMSLLFVADLGFERTQKHDAGQTEETVVSVLPKTSGRGRIYL